MSRPWLAYVWTTDDMYKYNLQASEMEYFIVECQSDPTVTDIIVFDDYNRLMHDESAHVGLLQTEYGDKNDRS